jgi:hypothetical protein
MFNGPGYDLQWLLDKARYEFDTTMRDGEAIRFTENAANLSVSLAHMADWVLAFKPVHFSNCTNLEDVRQVIRTECPEADYFLDIANEYKHAHRTKPNKTVAQVILYFGIYDAPSHSVQVQAKRQIRQSANGGAKTYVLTPKVKDLSGNEHDFGECVEKAIAWWTTVI